MTMMPKTEQELAELVAGGSGPFRIVGGGTRTIGLAEGEVLSTRGLRGVKLYEPGSLTLVVGAGTLLSEVEGLLESEGQRLAFEAPSLGGLLGVEGRSTIGGVVAGNASGPRRMVAGAARDFSLGVRFVDGRGEVVKNGGRVMKNVTGYDLVKLMSGSHGTLGVLTEVSLKTQPMPETQVSLMFEGLSADRAVALMSAALGSPFEVSGASHLPEAGGAAARTVLRLEGFEKSVSYRSGSLQVLLAPFGEAAVLEKTDSEAMWLGIRDVQRFAAAEGDVWRISTQPSKAAEIVAAINPLDAFYDWGGGLIWALTASGTDIRPHVSSGHATLVRAAEADKRRLGVFPPENAIVAKLSEGLRRQFDPDAKLNRGMMG